MSDLQTSRSTRLRADCMRSSAPRAGCGHRLRYTGARQTPAGVAKWQTQRTQNAPGKPVRVRIPLPAPTPQKSRDHAENQCGHSFFSIMSLGAKVRVATPPHGHSGPSQMFGARDAGCRQLLWTLMIQAGAVMALFGVGQLRRHHRGEEAHLALQVV